MKRMTTREIQEVNLATLKFVDSFCKSHGIRYWLSDGTLIGAIRHNGFIPWDDDMDITMPRPDYERFVKEFKDTRKYKLFTPERGNSYMTYARVCEMEETCFKVLIPWTSERCGVPIDIFPVNGGPQNESEFDPIAKECGQIRQDIVAFRKKASHLERIRRNAAGFLVDIVRVVLHSLRRMVLWHTVRPLLDRRSMIDRQFDYGSSDNGFCLAVTMNRTKFWPKAWFDSTIDHKFEDGVFPVPIGYHEILTKMYGDYMTPPSKDNQGTHSWQLMYWKDK